MTSDLQKTNWKLYLGVPAFIFFSCFLITFSQGFKTHHQVFSLAIVFDLVITAPLIYLLLIWKTQIYRATVFRIMVLGITLAGFMLGSDSSIIQLLKTWLAPLLEMTVVFIVVRKFYLVRKASQAHKNNNADFLIHCREILWKVLGNQKAAYVMASEFAVFYYAFIPKTKKRFDKEFTSYKNTALIIILYTFVLLMLVETLAVHFLIAMKSDLWAWIMSAMSLYTSLQLFAHIRAIKLRPITINDQGLDLHMGLASDAFIDFDNIETVDLFSKDKESNHVKIALLDGLEEHNIKIKLKEPVEVTKMFGIKKSSDTILFFVDEPLNLIELIKQKNIL